MIPQPHRGHELVRPSTPAVEPQLVWVELLTQMPRPRTVEAVPEPVQARLLAQPPLPVGTPKTEEWFRIYEDQLEPYGESDEQGVITITDRAGYHWGLPGERILARRYARGKYEPVTSGAPVHYATTNERISGGPGMATVYIRGRESQIQVFCPTDVLKLPYGSFSAVRRRVPVAIQATLVPSNYMLLGGISMPDGMYFHWFIQPLPPSKLE